MTEAAEKLDRLLDTCGHTEGMMEDVGFVDVVRIPFSWPQNLWPKGKMEKELGMWVQENMVSGIEAMSPACLCVG
jgi:hypothetical protein